MQEEPSEPECDARKALKNIFNILVGLAGFMFWYIIVVAYLQDAFGPMVVAWLVACVVVVFSMFSLQELHRRGWLAFVLSWAVPALIAWILLAGTFHSWSRAVIDLSCITVAFFVAELLVLQIARAREDWEKRPLTRKGLEQVVALFIAWVLVSLVTVLTTRPLGTDPQRFARMSPGKAAIPAASERWQPIRIGLALSGGGYRAAVLHAGVLQALEDVGVRVQLLSTVSGGSIIGSYYAVGGDPHTFVKAVSDGRFDLRRQLLLIHNTLRLPCPVRLPGTTVTLMPLCDFDRLDVQKQLVHRLLLSDSPLAGGLGVDEPNLGQPHLMIAATDLRYGLQVGVLPDGVLLLGEGDLSVTVRRGETITMVPPLDLSERVAISGAFPVAFPARKVALQVAPRDGGDPDRRTLLLTDGGVRDNLGLELLRGGWRRTAGKPATKAGHERLDLLPSSWSLDAILVSDGGAVAGVLDEDASGLALLPRVFEVISQPSRPSGSPSSSCRVPPVVQFSASELHQGTDLESETQRARWFVSMEPHRYPEPILRRLVALIGDAETRSRAEKALASYLDEWNSHQIQGSRWTRALQTAMRSGTCTSEGANPYADETYLAGACEALELGMLIRHGVVADLEVFRSTSTLEDRLPRKVAATLERLGKTLVYLEWPNLSESLDTAARCAASSPTAPAPPGLPG